MTIKLTAIISTIILSLVTACSDSKENDGSSPLPSYSQDIKKDLDKFATELAANTKNNIFKPTVEETKPNYYVITFQTSDPNLMTKDTDTDSTINDAVNAVWGSKFCTAELESIILKYSITRVEGRILNSAKFLAMCDGSTSTTQELLEKDIQDNLNRIRYMSEQMDQLK